MRARVFLQSPPSDFSRITRNNLMRTTRLIEQQQLSKKLTVQQLTEQLSKHLVQLLEQQLVSEQAIVQPHEQTVEHPEHQLRTQTVEQPPLDA
ncbi:hypothetical protein QL285_030371 [Trifolium repens]|nr:hypothetical protein QL285_030371 [Trifolium repens]